MTISNTCMGIFQFGMEKYELFDKFVKPLVESHTGLKYIDARTYYESKTIKMDLIKSMILDATVLIIDISEKNANVFTELGIAYCVDKPMVLICSEYNWKKIWKEKAPFDLKGREVLIFKDDNDLKVKLGRYIFDALYKTKEITPSWISINPINHIKSPSEIEINGSGAIWTDIGVKNNFTVRYDVTIHNTTNPAKNPDVRLYFSTAPDGYPRVVNIFPWEDSQIDVGKYECHIDFFPAQTAPHYRLQQVSVATKTSAYPIKFGVFVSVCVPNLVFESSFFEDKVNRLVVSIRDLIGRGYPYHMSQYIGFESINSRVTIDSITIKSILVP